MWKTHKNGWWHFIIRIQKEYYTDLSNIVKSSWTQWTSFQNATIADFRKVRGILDNAREQLHSLSNSSNASFLQVSENSQYFTNLNEIRVNFENTKIDSYEHEQIREAFFQSIKLKGVSKFVLEKLKSHAPSNKKS